MYRKAAIMIALLIAVAGCELIPRQDSSNNPDGTDLLQAIAQLETRPEIDSGYDRDEFGGWIDADQDGCDTRSEVLIAEDVSGKTSKGECDTLAGRWESYYDVVTVNDPSDLDIDHMVPLSEAWASGAAEWTKSQRVEYANDMGDERSLIAVTASTNRSKSDRDPAEWLPPDPDAECRYITEWVVVKIRWQLSVDSLEQAALEEIAAGCPEQTVDVVIAV